MNRLMIQMEKLMENEENSCNESSDVVKYLYLEVNAWILNGTVYTDLNRAMDASRTSDGQLLQLYKKVWNPDATNSD